MEDIDNLTIGKRLIDLIEKIIFRKPPFTNFTWPKEVAYEVLEKYHLYKDEIDKKTKNNLIRYFKLTAIEEFGRWTGFSESRSFYDRHPDLIESRDKFCEWYKEKEGTNYTPFITGYSGLNPEFDVNKIIKETIRERDSSYKIAKKKPIHGARSFYKNLSEDNKLYVGFERGSLRSFMSFMIGFEKPWIGFDIGNLFLSGQSYWDYQNITESISKIKGGKRLIVEYSEPTLKNLTNTVNKAFDLLDYLLPHLLETLCIKTSLT